MIDIYNDRSENVIYDYSDFPVYVRRAHLSIYPNYAADSHWHDDIELIAVPSGKMRYNINCELITLNTGEGVFVNTRQLHYGYDDAGDQRRSGIFGIKLLRRNLSKKIQSQPHGVQKARKETNMITIKIIDREHKADINIKNEPFKLYGLMLPSYNNGKWDHTVINLPVENHTEMCFPDENYDYEKMSENHVFIGAYDGNRCIGLAIMRDAFFKYMYLYDLKVNSAYRSKGIGAMLIDKCKEVAVAQGYRGVYTQGQDNNLGACKFYLKCGFEIGGINTFDYNGTSQENKNDIFFYIDA